MGCNTSKNTAIDESGRMPPPQPQQNQNNNLKMQQMPMKQEIKIMALEAPRDQQTGKLMNSKFPFWHQIIDYLNFEELTKASTLSHHLMNEATHNHIFSKYDKPFQIDNNKSNKSNQLLNQQNPGKTINTKRDPQQLFNDDQNDTGEEGEEDEEWEDEDADPNQAVTEKFKKTKEQIPQPNIQPIQQQQYTDEELAQMGNTFNTVSQFPKQAEHNSKHQNQQPQQRRPSFNNQPSLGKKFTLIREEDEDLEQSFQSHRKVNPKAQEKTKDLFKLKPMHNLVVPQQRIDLPIEQYIRQQDKVEISQRSKDELNRTMVFRKSLTQDQQDNIKSQDPLNNIPYKRQGESVVYKVVINSVVDSSLDQLTLKRRVSYEFKLPPEHQPAEANSSQDPYFFNSQDGSIMQQTKNSFLNTPVHNSEIADTPKTIKQQHNNVDYFQNMSTLKVEQNQYAILYSSNNDNKIQKQFGVYQFDNDQPVIEKRPQRLIERIAIKQEIEGTQYKKRSIPGGAGLQIVFQNNQRPNFEDKMTTKAQYMQDELPKRLPKFDEVQKQKTDLIQRNIRNPIQKMENELFWGYLSRADRLELQKLYKLSEEISLIRNFKDLSFNKPFPYTQARESRTISPLYVAVATGSLDCLKTLFEELVSIDIESGIDIQKKSKDDNEQVFAKNDKSHKKRTPLQLACALGLFTIVEFLLSKGANPNGINTQDFQNIDPYAPPILICINQKLRNQLCYDELLGIELWQIFNQIVDIDHLRCLDILLKHKGDPNLDVSQFSQSKPYPIFHCLNVKRYIEKLIYYGCNVNLQNQEQMNPICKICNRKSKNGQTITEEQEQKELEIVDTLLIIGNSKIVYCCKLNPVLESITNKKYKIAQYLAQKGGDVNWRGPQAQSAVQIAVDQNNTILLKEILSWPKLDPIDFYYVDQEGKNIFHRIAEKQNPELFVKIAESSKFNPAMIFKYINETIVNRGFETLPVLLCAPSLELAELYIRFGARVDHLPFNECFNLLSSQPSFRFLEFLIKQGGLNINEQDQYGKTSLMRASEENNLKQMQFLLRLGADPDAQYQDDIEQKQGMTLLHDACLYGYVEKAKILLSYGANFNLKCGRGRTTLDFLKTNHEKKSNRRKEEIKTLLYKYTVKNSILNKQ